MVKVDSNKILNKKKAKRKTRQIEAEPPSLTPEPITIKEEVLDDSFDIKPSKAELDNKKSSVVTLGTLQFNKVECGKQIEFEATKFRKKKGISRDPFKALAKLKETREKISRLEEQGKLAVAEEIVNKRAWKAALLKAEGLKVKDDIELAQKSVKRKLEKKARSKKKWEQRIQSHEKAKEARQKKRRENLKQRRQEKKKKIIKKLVKKGRYVKGV